MKILYVASKYDYGRPEQGFSFEHYNFYDTLVKMNNSENKVIYFPVDEIILNKGEKKMNELLLKTAFEEKPDLIFFINGGTEIKKEIIQKLTKESGAITFNWFCDDPWKFESYSRHWAPLYNFVATTDFRSFKKYQKTGYKNVIYTQWACNHFFYKPLNSPKIYDVTFVGLPHGKRKKIIEKIKKAGIEVKCWGRGWPNGRVSQEEMLRIFSQSKINLNFAGGSTTLLKAMGSIFLSRSSDRSFRINNPRYWLGNLKAIASVFRKQIKARNFEVLGCKGFLLTEYVEHLEEYYKIGREIDCFHNISELIEKIRYYLPHEKEREAIAEAGYRRTFKDHTYEKRFNEIFKLMGLA